MTQKSAMNNHELAQVLSRINLLVDQNLVDQNLVDQNQVQAEEVEDASIPLLTEVYAAESKLLAVQLPDFPVLSELAHQVTQQAAKDQQTLTPEMAERFLEEVRPLLLKTVKIAVLEESVKAEKLLTAKLEQEILVLLRDRLVTNLR